MSPVHEISTSLNCDLTRLQIQTKLHLGVYTAQQIQCVPAEPCTVQLAGSEVQVALCMSLVAVREADKQ
jgi:hypothetical protein